MARQSSRATSSKIVATGGINEDRRRAELRPHLLVRCVQACFVHRVGSEKSRLTARLLNGTRAPFATLGIAAEHGDLGAGFG